MTKTPQTLFDRFHTATYSRPGNYAEKIVSQDILDYRIQLRKAQAFTLDNEAVTTIVRTSLAPPNKIGLWAHLARSPYDVTWIEWNQHHRLREAHRLGSTILKDGAIDPDTPTESGFLLVRDPSHECRYRAFFVTDLLAEKERRSGAMGGVDVAPWAVSYLIDPNRGLIHPDIPISSDDALREGIQRLYPTEEEWDHIVSGMGEISKNRWHKLNLIATATGWGYVAGEEEYSLTGDGLSRSRMRRLDQRAFGFPTETYGYALATPEPILTKLLQSVEGKPGGKETSAATYYNVAHEQAGDLRFLVTALALINEIPYRTSQITKPSHHTTRTRKISYLAQSTISLIIPKTRPIQFIEKRLNTADKRRAHMVRGHWRVYENRRTWIKPHQRGDASLGWVKHKYEVTS